MSVYFHTCAFLTSALPLAIGMPQHAVMPSSLDVALLLGVAGTSFWGQMLIGRGFQLLQAAQASAINFTQVSGDTPSLLIPFSAACMRDTWLLFWKVHGSLCSLHGFDCCHVPDVQRTLPLVFPPVAS